MTLVWMRWDLVQLARAAWKQLQTAAEQQAWTWQ